MRHALLCLFFVGTCAGAAPACEVHESSYYRDEAHSGSQGLTSLAIHYCTMEKVRADQSKGIGKWTNDDAQQCKVEQDKLYDALSMVQGSQRTADARERINACVKEYGRVVKPAG